MRKWLFPLALAALTLSCAKEDEQIQTPSAAPLSEEVEAGPVYVEGVAEVLLDESMASLAESDPAAAALQLGAEYLERIFPYDPENEAAHREAGLHRWYRTHYNPAKPLTKASADMGSIPGVEVVNPVYKISRPSVVFNDPLYGRQWHYDNPGTQWADVNALPVWEAYTTGNPAVIVSVVDGGIDPAHEDLADNYIPGGADGSKSFMSGNPGYRIVAHSHGTHVAGTIAAVNNNGIGVAGIAGGDAKAGKKGVRLMSCQVFQNSQSAGYGNFEEAMVWGADHGAVISNNSWGYDFTDDAGNYNKAAAKKAHEDAIKPISEAPTAFKSAVEYFNSHAGMKGGVQTGPMAGGIMFFAAGNEGQPYGAPGCYPGCMSVGAITSYGTRSNFSNYGDWVDICAPGVDIMSTLPDNSYGLLSGTSMACPHVTGVAALVISYCGGEGFTRDQLWDKLIGGANNADIAASYRIGPLVDALGAISYGSGEPPAPVSDLALVGVKSNFATVSLTVPADKDGKPAYGFRVLAAKTKAALQSCDPRNPGQDIVQGSFLSREAKVGDKIQGTIGDLGFSSHYYIAISAYDYGRNFSAISNIVEADTGENHAPTITTTYTGDYKFHVHDNFTIPFTIEDPDGHVVNVEFIKDAADEGGALRLLESVKEGEYDLQVLGNVTGEGVYHATLKVWDNYGPEITFPITYEILPNAAPVKVKDMENLMLRYGGDMVKIDMHEYIQDPDGEKLNYTISITDRSVVHVSQTAGTETLVVTALSDEGMATVNLSATDAGGRAIETSFVVLVRSSEVKFQAYPNPVVSVLYVGTGNEPEFSTISLISSSGVTVFKQQFYCSAFAPAEINVKPAAPGIYTLRVETGGEVYKATIVKQ